MDLMNRCQIITPAEGHWFQAAETLSVMRKREHDDRSKVRDLAMDVLIALSARSIGAAVITCNKADFQAIHRHLSFHLVYWD